MKRDSIKRLVVLAITFSFMIVFVGCGASKDESEVQSKDKTEVQSADIVNLPDMTKIISDKERDVKSLEALRDEIAKKGYEEVYKKGKDGTGSFDDYYTNAVMPALEDFFNKQLKDKSNEDRIRGEIELLSYLNENKMTYGSDYGFMSMEYCALKSYEFIKSKGKDELMKLPIAMSKDELKSYYDFLAQNLEELMKSNDSAVWEIFNQINPKYAYKLNKDEVKAIEDILNKKADKFVDELKNKKDGLSNDEQRLLEMAKYIKG